MRNLAIILLLGISINLFGQEISGIEINKIHKYSENSELRVIYKDSLKKFHSKTKPAGIFVNGIFIGDESVVNAINSEKIESLNIEKENFEKNGKEYYGKILVKMKLEYIPKFITLSELFKKYLDLDKKPIVFQINENVINQDYKEYLVDENFILKIIVTKIKTSEKSTEINLIKLTTKTKENIKEANVIRIKGSEI